MPKQHYRYSYYTIDIFQKLSDYYASLTSKFEEEKNQKYHQNVLFEIECKSK